MEISKFIGSAMFTKVADKLFKHNSLHTKLATKYFKFNSYTYKSNFI